MKTDRSLYAFRIMGYIYISIFVLACFLPFWLIVAGSFTQESAIYKYGYKLIPKVFSLEAYKLVFLFPQDILNAYIVSITLTVVGSVVGIFLTAMTAYVILRKDFKYRNKLSFFYYFTMLFSGGLVPYYLLIVRYLHLKDTLFALLLPSLMSAYLIILTKNFMKSIPDSIMESAKIDGAGDFRVFLQFIIPLSKPGLATIGLFIALGYWNDWWGAMLFIDSKKLYPLQYLLYKIIQGAEGLKLANTAGAGIVMTDLPTESLKMATAVVATGPIILLYPYVQRYFIKGLVIGSVKG